MLLLHTYRHSCRPSATTHEKCYPQLRRISTVPEQVTYEARTSIV
jgi:hypothetical protein